MHNLKKLYLALNHYTYLDTATHGLLSTTLVEHKSKLHQQLAVGGSIYAANAEELIHNARHTLANFLDAAPQLTALVPNFSLAFNALLEGISSSHTFLLVKGDYPSVNWPVEARGFNCYYATLNATLEQNIWQACEEHQPDFLALSLVQYISGIKINLDFLKELKVQFPDLIIIADATQFIGVEEFRFRESGIDIIAASCYKWLNAGDGNAFMAFKEEVAERVKPKYTGYNSKQGFKNDRGSFMGHFEPGHQDSASFSGLEKAIEFVNDYSIHNICSKIQHLATTAKHRFAELDLIQPEVVLREQHSSIFNISGDQRLHDRLRKENILTAMRGPGIRVSFSYYNDESDLDQLIECLKKYDDRY
ncbi:aminotransferase class V-fold PLP-dependent enzyme [Nonlabens marinus]|uniref:Cysteine desulfurase n=1 Tax=Nonlabens marinus S1-08 TaxID=1454201 RepID=W8VV39_9FLAO|nr:aminotransferase class V-fold PLP-dependent enzyme [Nonlabens marinus]BAO55108.1 cysteine desulfurase [Nonlabens marinus S1-08]